MSGFFGIFRPQGGPVDLEAFEQMKTAMNRKGFDGMETHVEEKIAMGHLMLRVSPESKYDKQPLKSSCGNYLLVGHFRLDYRDELGDKLGLTQSALDITTDSQLAMLAFLKWKEKCVHHLEGDWAFAIYNLLLNVILLARDSSGVSSLFFFRKNGVFYFASDSRYILLAKNITFDIDKEKLFQMTNLFYQPQNRQTLISGLNYLKSAERLIVDDNLDFSYFGYNEFRIIEKIKYKFKGDYILDLSYVYSTAIKSRLNDQGPVGIYLSGGKDSSSVSYFSSKELECKKKELYSFTSVPLYDIDSLSIGQKITDETSFVKDLVSKNKNINATFLKFPSFQFDYFFEKSWLYEPYNPIVSKNSFWLKGIIDEAKKNDIKTILVGQLGNDTITYNGFYYYSDLLIRLKLFSLLKEFSREFKFSEKGLAYSIKNQLLIPSAQYVRFTYNAFKYQKTSRFSKFYILPPTGFLGKWMDSKMLLNFIKSFFIPLSKKRESQLKKNIDNFGNIWYLISNHLHVQVADPTSDSRLIIFLLSIPQNLFFQNSIHKNIFRLLMNNRLPNSILWNNKYQYQSFDFSYRLAGDRNFSFFLMEMLAKTPKNEFFDPAQFLDSYRKIVASPEIYLENDSLFEFLRCFSLNCFYNYNLKS